MTNIVEKGIKPPTNINISEYRLYTRFVINCLYESLAFTMKFLTKFSDVSDFTLVNDITLSTKITGSLSLVTHSLHGGSYMSAHVLLNLLNKLRKRDKVPGLPSILSFLLTSLINSITQDHEC